MGAFAGPLNGNTGAVPVALNCDILHVGSIHVNKSISLLYGKPCPARLIWSYEHYEVCHSDFYGYLGKDRDKA